ncbi:hypothetical protein [Polaribacter sp. Hel1_85]|uniref:hypothetical protein n=1 Tax=Polaribacter sp. Hel1_85 TaxID=1250005 RepID=UPI00055E1554|nr:hypothetical protein [Polaribacter sp. Hel1_85]
MFNFYFRTKQRVQFNKIDSTWGQEVIRFPARDMDYIGVGDIRFPPNGWIKPEHTFFWSYTYAWSIDVNRKISTSELELDLEKYFNSLNRVDVTNKNDKRIATATVSKIKRNKSVTFYEGKVHTYDRFATNKRFTLNVKIKSHFCIKTQKTVLLFTFSPKEFKHEVWKTLNEIELEKGVCKH